MTDKQLQTPPKKPLCDTTEDFVLFEQFWIATGDQAVADPSHYILTDSIRKHLANLARAVLSRKYPVLLQASYFLLPLDITSILLSLLILGCHHRDQHQVVRLRWWNT